MWLINLLTKIFKYLEPVWIGNNGKPSIRKVLALAFAYDLMDNISYAVQKFEVGKSLADVALVVGIEAGLIAGLLALQTYSSVNMFNKTVESEQTETIKSE